MYEKPRVGLIVLVKSFRKTKGGKRDGRNNFTGKIAKVFKDENGMCGDEIFSTKGATFKEVSKELRKSGFVPSYVTINTEGVTHI